MIEFLELLLVALVSYLIGAVPFGYLVARWRGLDIFKEGSGNIGATNVGRVLGRRFGIVVLLLDFAKGALPVLVATRLAAEEASGAATRVTSWGVVAGLCAFLGHLFPVYLRFRGGKGVATGAGVVFVLMPLPALGAMLMWVVVAAATRYVSLASITASASLCWLQIGISSRPFSFPDILLTAFSLLALSLIVFRHKANLVRLLQGNENRLRESRALALVTEVTYLWATGIWLGSIVFFTLGAPAIFRSFQSVAEQAENRPAWLPLPPHLDLEQANQLAGLAVAPLFAWYYPLQAICGALALVTALSWSVSNPRGRIDKGRSLVVGSAFVILVASWLLAGHVARLRVERYDPNPVIAEIARDAFMTWHGVSLILNFLVLVLVAVAMALAARRPSTDRGSATTDPFNAEAVTPSL